MREKGWVPLRWFVFWWFLLLVADLLFYVLLTPLWRPSSGRVLRIDPENVGERHHVDAPQSVGAEARQLRNDEAKVAGRSDLPALDGDRGDSSGAEVTVEVPADEGRNQRITIDDTPDHGA